MVKRFAEPRRAGQGRVPQVSIAKSLPDKAAGRQRRKAVESDSSKNL
jgi:hypothetical protein